MATTPVQLTRQALGLYELRLLAVNGIVRVIEKLTLSQVQRILARLPNYVFIRGL